MYAYPVPYLTFLAHFHLDYDYFECHEVLEEHWKNINGSRDSVWVGLIQASVFLYHYRRGNQPGARRMAEKAVRCLEQNQSALRHLGLDGDRLLFLIQQSAEKMEQARPFEPFALPLADERLQLDFQRFARSFQAGSDAFFILHKHQLRDRSDVIQAREAAMATKKTGKVTT